MGKFPMGFCSSRCRTGRSLTCFFFSFLVSFRNNVVIFGSAFKYPPFSPSFCGIVRTRSDGNPKKKQQVPAGHIRKQTEAEMRSIMSANLKQQNKLGDFVEELLDCFAGDCPGNDWTHR